MGTAALVWCLLAISTFAEEVPLPTVQTLIQQHQQAIENIRTLHTKYTWTHVETSSGLFPPDTYEPGDRLTMECSAELWQKGEHYLQDVTRVWSSDMKKVSKKDRFIVLLNDTAFAKYSDDSKTLYVWRFDSHLPVDSRARMESKAWPMNDPKNCGFLITRTPLANVYEFSQQYADGFEWNVTREEVDGSQCYRLRLMGDIHGKPWVRDEVLMDAEKDYLLAEATSYTRKGLVRASTKTTFSKSDSGKWFPKESLQNTGSVLSPFKMQFSYVEVNQPISEDRFAVENMSFEKDGVLMVEIPAGGGETIEQGYCEGKWVPVEQLEGKCREAYSQVHSPTIIRLGESP